MCLIVSTTIHRECIENTAYTNIPVRARKPHTFDKDIVVYKGLLKTGTEDKNEYLTPIMHYPVKFENGIITMEVENFEGQVTLYGKTTIEKGIHSFNHCLSAKYVSYQDVDAFIAVIPKGTEFYFGESNDMVSKKLIIFQTNEAYDEYAKTHERVTSSNAWLRLFEKQ